MTTIMNESALPTRRSTDTVLAAGVWLVRKARAQAAQSGTYAAARNLKKQGIPLELALAILRRSA